MTAKPIRVLIVDDSRFFRDYMSRTLSMDFSVEVVGVVSDPSEVMQVVSECNPNIITLDIEIQNLHYKDFIPRLKRIYPNIPIIVISPLGPGVFEALKAGAVDFVSKPNVQLRFDNKTFMHDVLGKIKTVYANTSGRGAAPAMSLPHTTIPLKQTLPRPPLPASVFFPGAEQHIVAIGASTGGTEAILAVVRDLPANTPGVVIVQHMPPVFTRMYAERLDKACKMTVQEAKDGDHVRPGLILLAEGSQHMRVIREHSGGYAVRMQAGEKVSGHCPSVDVLFESVAIAAGSKSVGVLLTGMGSDGAKNLLKMRECGAYTIGQDEETSVVYGMPMVAYNLGAVTDQLPLGAIPGAIIKHLSK